MSSPKTGNTRRIALVAVLTALCLAIQLTPRPPNVEFTSLFSFIVGFVFGAYVGVLFGGFVMFVNGFFSSWGFAGVNLPFQMAGMAIVGFVGGFYRRRFLDFNSVRLFEVAVLGASLTVLYDVLTNLGVALSYVVIGIQPNLAVVTAFAYGTPFSAIHVVSNIAVFGTIFLPLIRALNHDVMVKKTW